MITGNIKTIHERDQDIETDLREHNIYLSTLQATKMKRKGQTQVREWVTKTKDSEGKHGNNDKN